MTDRGSKDPDRLIHRKQKAGYSVFQQKVKVNGATQRSPVRTDEPAWRGFLWVPLRSRNQPIRHHAAS
ncbi:MAG: hypothetical protein KatS3mg104_0306 [Phycisphaerae bacterium]|nr:MAG: hypothetical protein KatS3mg104_0306 [Phycisphaerae bacterium]